MNKLHINGPINQIRSLYMTTGANRLIMAKPLFLGTNTSRAARAASINYITTIYNNNIPIIYNNNI